MIRWPLWFVLVPQGYLLCGWLAERGGPAFDVGALVGVFCVLFAARPALPGLLLGAAVGRALVDEAGLGAQILVLGVPIAALLPLRGLFYRQHLWWQATAAAAFAVAIPKLAGLCGRWFDQPSSSAALDGWRILSTALLGPLLLVVLRRLPPLRSFAERGP
jgi:hypothetical protein